MSQETIRFLSIKEVVTKTRLARSTIYAKVAKGEFPSPIKISDRASAFIEAEIEDWARSKVIESRGDYSSLEKATSTKASRLSKSDSE